jgi:hypothetical protein
MLRLACLPGKVSIFRCCVVFFLTLGGYACDLYPYFDVDTQWTVQWRRNEAPGRFLLNSPYAFFQDPALRQQGLVRSQLERLLVTDARLVSTSIPHPWSELGLVSLVWERDGVSYPLASGDLSNQDANARTVALTPVKYDFTKLMRGRDGNLLLESNRQGALTQDMTMTFILVWSLKIHTAPETLFR